MQFRCYPNVKRCVCFICKYIDIPYLDNRMHVVEGKFEFTINGKKHLCVKGSTFHIPSNVPHSGKAITSCVIMDVFSPKRDDLG